MPRRANDKNKKLKQKAEEFLELGAAISRGDQSQFGRVHSKGRPDYAELSKMLVDPTVSNAIELISCAITATVGAYVHDNASITDYVNRQMESLHGDFGSIVRMVCSALWKGMAVIEICAEVENGELTLKNLLPVPQEKIYFRFANDGTSLDIEDIIINYSTSNEVSMPKNKAITLRVDADYLHPYGVSRLEAVRDSWQKLTALKENWINASNRYSSPFMVYHLQNPRQKVDNGFGGFTTAFENAKNALNGQGLVKGTICCGDDSIELITPEEISPQMVSACEYYEKLIYRGLLIPSLLTDSGDVGSYALGKEHSSLFNMVINNLANIVKDCLLEQLIRPLVSFQFGEQENWGKFEQEEFEDDVLEDKQSV